MKTKRLLFVFFFAFLKFLGDAKLNFFVLMKKNKKIFCVFWKKTKNPVTTGTTKLSETCLS